jgi:hypothetical protein
MAINLWCPHGQHDGGVLDWQVDAVTQMHCGLQLFGAAFEGVVFARLQIGDAGVVDIKSERVAVLAKLNRQRQTNLAQANEGDGFVLQVHGCDSV